MAAVLLARCLALSMAMLVALPRAMRVRFTQQCPEICLSKAWSPWKTQCVKAECVGCDICACSSTCESWCRVAAAGGCASSCCKSCAQCIGKQDVAMETLESNTYKGPRTRSRSKTKDRDRRNEDRSRSPRREKRAEDELAAAALSRFKAIVDLHGKAVPVSAFGCGLESLAPDLQVLEVSEVGSSQMIRYQFFGQLCLDMLMFSGADKNEAEISHINNCLGKAWSGTQSMKLADGLMSCFNQKVASLDDESQLKCEKRGNLTMPLALFRSLTKGQTWYQSFGFEHVARARQFGGYGSQAMEVSAIQKALHALTFQELQLVEKQCGSYTRVDGSAREVKPEDVQWLFREFKRLKRGLPSAGDFFNWVWSNYCHLAKDVLFATMAFNKCPTYLQTAASQALASVIGMPNLHGDMKKIVTRFETCTKAVVVFEVDARNNLHAS